MENKNGRRLSAEAIENLRTIYYEEFDEELTDDGVEVMGVELLHFFSLLWSLKASDIDELTDQESRALEFIRRTLDAEQRSPSVREIAHVIGLKSSRSGFRVVQRLIAKEVLHRAKDGKLKVNGRT